MIEEVFKALSEKAGNAHMACIEPGDSKVIKLVKQFCYISTQQYIEMLEELINSCDLYKVRKDDKGEELVQVQMRLVVYSMQTSIGDKATCETLLYALQSSKDFQWNCEKFTIYEKERGEVSTNP